MEFLEDLEFYLCWLCFLLIPYNLVMWIAGWIYVKFFYRASKEDELYDSDTWILMAAMPAIPVLLFFSFVKKILAKRRIK